MDSNRSDTGGRTIVLGPAFGDNLVTRQPVAFRHELLAEPALELAAIADLADSLGPDSVTCEDADRPLVYADGAPEPKRVRRPGDVVRDLDDNRSWLTLLNIEQSPRYRALIDGQLDRLAAQCGLPPRALRRRMGFVFASSPGSVTGAHFDIEHSLLLQLRGNRVLTFGEFADQGSRDHEVSRYWNGSYGKLTSLPVRPQDMTIGPGDGVYIPPYRPHWLHNGDRASLSLTITFFTRDNDRESLAQAFNERARKLGLTPRREGESPVRDRMKATAMRGAAAARRIGRR
jgi:hypothetical protein